MCTEHNMLRININMELIPILILQLISKNVYKSIFPATNDL